MKNFLPSTPHLNLVLILAYPKRMDEILIPQGDFKIVLKENWATFGSHLLLKIPN